MKGQILICTAIMLNNHSNPYIESTTVLSDSYIIIFCMFSKYLSVCIMFVIIHLFHVIISSFSLL